MSRFFPTRQTLDAVDASRSSASSLDPALSNLSPEDAEVLEAIVAKSPKATTFMTVFKAYSEVLQQRGLDPGNDVVYYKQLLKLGVVKGVDWGTKWKIVRDQLGFDLKDVTALLDSSEVLNEVPIRSSTPLPRFREDRSCSPTPKPRYVKGKGRELPANRINEEEAWTKVEQERQVQDADRFRRESLLFMCFETWKVGLDWIHSTHAQIDNARNQIQLRRFFDRWRERSYMVKKVYENAAKVARFRTLSASFALWRTRARQKKIEGWRHNMRNRMSTFLGKRDERIRNDAWTKWRQLYQAHQLYARCVLVRIFRRWREKSLKVAALELLGDSVEEARERRTLGNAMETWSRRIQMRDIERYIVYKVAQRTLTSTFEIWTRNTQDNHCADTHHTLLLLNRTLNAWRNAKAKLHTLTQRGEWQLRRRDNLLLRAVMHVWVSRERGQLLQRVKSTRLTKDAFFIWRQRRQEQLKSQNRALDIARLGSIVLLASAFRTWTRHFAVRQNRLLLGDQHYTATLLSRILLVWRLQLRAKLRMARRAKTVRKYFLEKQVWDKWRFALAESRRKRTFQQFEKGLVKRTFLRWLAVTRKNRNLAQGASAIQRSARLRILRTTLQRWTDRVVNFKLREIDVVEQHERDIMAWAFATWKDTCHQHVENLSLVNSFQDVKREDTLRRIFLRWSSAARKSKDRRTRLAEREHELRVETIRAAWDIWRDRFRDNMLRSIEYQVIIQHQTNVIYRTFVIWHSRSKSVPGIRFYAINLKMKVWERWRAAMPLAVQARKARKTHTRHVLSAAFKKWAEVYRTKLALKAIARARYLRLPSPGQRAQHPVSDAQAPLRPLLHRQRAAVPSPDNDDDDAPAVVTREGSVFRQKRRLSSLLVARPASRAATAVEVPPARVTPTLLGGNGDQRERLWNELRGVGSGRGRAKSR